MIVDANVVPKVFSATPHHDFQPVWNALSKKRATAVYGGELAREYAKLRRYRKIILELDRQGVLRKKSDDEVDEMTKVVKREKLCKSNDPHIIALARVADTRLLCSHDQDLHADFTNLAVLQPKGSVYQNRSHRRLIARHCGKKRTFKHHQ